MFEIDKDVSWASLVGMARSACKSNYPRSQAILTRIFERFVEQGSPSDDEAMQIRYSQYTLLSIIGTALASAGSSVRSRPAAAETIYQEAERLFDRKLPDTEQEIQEMGLRASQFITWATLVQV